MDEPTAALDAESEKRVLDYILTQRKRRTVILVTHSLTAASRCDRVFVMQAGRIVEWGTPLELLNRGGLYANLVQSRRTPHRRRTRRSFARLLSRRTVSPPDCLAGGPCPPRGGQQNARRR